MKRSVVREHVFKILFRYDFYDKESFMEQVKLYFEQYPNPEDDNEIEDCAEISELEQAEIEARVMAVVANVGDIDEKISAVAEGWKFERIGKAELTILRLAIYEMLYDESVDKAVAINEAVILSKKYCADKSHKFVNGVLAKITE